MGQSIIKSLFSQLNKGGSKPDYLGGIMNLLKETEKILKQNRKSLDDIKWVGCTTHDWHDWKQFDGIKTKSEFIKWADFEYDN